MLTVFRFNYTGTTTNLPLLRLLKFSIVFSASLILSATDAHSQNFDFAGVILGQNGDGTGLSFALSSDNRPAFSFSNEPTNHIIYSELNNGTWSREIVDSSLTSLTSTSLTLLSAKPHIVYFDPQSNTLFHAQRVQGTWSREIIDNSSKTGPNPSITTCGNLLCVSYYDQTNNNLRFAKGTWNNWNKQTVDDTSDAVGSINSINITSNSNPVIAYYDSTNKRLKVATQNNNNSWNISALSYPNYTFGMWPSIAVDSKGKLHLSFAGYRNTDSNVNEFRLLYATKPVGGSWSISELDRPYVGAYSSIVLDSDDSPLIAYRYHRQNSPLDSTSSIMLQQWNSNVQSWTWTSISENNNAFHTYEYIKLTLDSFGYPIIAYHFSREDDQEAPSISNYSLQSAKDVDQDGFDNSSDNCPNLFNPTQTDTDGDNIGDICDSTPNGNSNSSSSSSSLPPSSSSSSSTQSSSSSNSSSSSRSSSSSSSNSTSSSSSSSSLPPPPAESPNVDSDNDGLTDEQERRYNTDPLRPDSDDDNVPDGQEITDGSNPNDLGSNLELLNTVLCSEWNGFLDGMFNYFEHVNLSNQALTIHTTIFDIQGQERGNEVFRLGPGAEYDIGVHDLEGMTANSYGKVCSTHNGKAGDLDGRMVYYKPSSNQDELNSKFEFALAMPLSNGKRSVQYVPFNTFQPSLAPQDRNNIVANWIQLINLGSTPSTGTLLFHGQDGSVLASNNITIEAGARRDYSGHRFGPSLVGLVEWRPNNSNTNFALRNIRYLYNNLTGENSFDTAFQVEGNYGSGQLLTVPLDTTDGSSIIELSNTSSQELSVSLNIYTENGELQLSNTIALSPHATFHLITDEYLSNRSGIATMLSSQTSSLLALVMQYSRTSDGGIHYMYGIPAKEALGTVLSGTYNTFLNQQSKLWLLNPSNNTIDTTISMVRSDGTIVLGNGLSRSEAMTDILVGETLDIPPHGLRSIDLNNFELPNNYGVVTIQPSRTNSTVAWITRKKGVEYVIPTPVRQ